MRSNYQREESRKKKYIFFSDPDVIVKRAETSAVAAQIKRDHEAQQVSEGQSAVLSVPTLGVKSLENLLTYRPVEPYPFTFINAVKQKFALGSRPAVEAKTEYSSLQTRASFTSSVLRANCKQNLYQVARKMDFIKPLKIPDLKISPKTLDFSSRENSVSKELPSMKSEMAAKEFAHDRFDKTMKASERVHRKLDFSSDGPSAINCESIEPLKAPNVSIAFNLNKKKENVRDSSREKENRSKRIKRDDSMLCARKDEPVQDLGKRGRSPKHISKRDGADSTSGTITTRLKNDRLPFHAAKNNDALSTKSKVRNFITSTAKKDNDKKQKSFAVHGFSHGFNSQSMDLTKDVHLESKGRACGNKVLDFLSSKVPDKITTRDNNGMAVLSSNIENKFKDICHLRQLEDLKYKCDLDNRQLKQDKPNTIHKEQTKRVSDKSKISNNKERKIHSSNAEEDIGYTSETNSSKHRIGIFPVISVQQSKDKDSETIIESKQNVNSVRSAKASENLKYTEHSVTQSTSTNTKQDEESYSQSTVTTKQTITNDDTNDIDVGALPNALYDPRRISFRDSSYSQQEEFHNLTTPDKMDLMLKSKQRRYPIQNSDSEVDARSSKYKLIVKSEEEQEKIQLIHPTALHMQFQAELHLLDSFNESIRQVMDVEKCLYNAKREQESKNPQKENNKDEGAEVVENRATVAADNDVTEKAWKPHDYAKNDVTEIWKSNDDAHVIREYLPSQGNVDESSDNYGKFNKAVVKVMEVQTQTVNDMATQTDTYIDKRKVQNRFAEIHGSVYERSFLGESENAQLTLDSSEQFKDIGQLEEVSQSRIRTMSEISLHETTSSIKTETGTEISISTRDLTCSYKSKEFNKYLGLEIAQLLEDEEQRHDRFEMLFKSREKTLNDRTKKLVELEEQKRALKDTGQDSRISSVKKKQRALVLKLQQEKDEINRLKELHEYTSQERRSVLAKQKELFNPHMSTKNILTKLKRSADSQSPRRLSGPMKGYDIRSNSSISSLIDSDKSHHDHSQIDARLQASESDIHLSKLDLPKSENFVHLAEESNISATRFDEPAEGNELQEKNPLKSQKNAMSNYELKSRKYEEKMPKADVLRLKQNQLDMESKRIQDRPMKIKRLLEKQELIEVLQTSRPELDASVLDPIKCESDALAEELSKKSRTSQMVDSPCQTAMVSKEKELPSNIVIANSRSMEEETNSKTQDIPKATKLSQISEGISQTSISSKTKKIDKSITSDRDISKKLQHNSELRTSAKRRSSKYQRTKSSILTENILRSKSHVTEEFIKHHDKRTRLEDELLQLDDNNESSILDELDLNESQESFQALISRSKAVKDKNSKLINKIINDYESKKNISGSQLNRKLENNENLHRNERIVQNVSTSQINTFAASHHSSEESEKSFLRSVVLRLQDRDFKMSKKPEQILTARETALASRKNCIEEWIAWDTRLRAEEGRVTRMEQATLKLVTATSSVLSQQDTTLSSDTSDVEGRIEILTEKLAERRIEMSRLKREVRKQAKQKLHALEANLLNQIKRYDTTILEMHKMLDSRKAIKDKNKLAIEPKSLAEFKVPEIPLKRIQDIYKNSDLLRSRSESDLLSTRNEKDSLDIPVTPVTYDDRHEKNSLQKSTKSTDIKSVNASKLKSTTDTANHSGQSIFEEYTSKEACEKLRTATSMSISSDVCSERYAVSVSTTNERQLGEFSETKPYSVSRENLEDIQTVISTARSESEVQRVSDVRSSEDRSIINTESTNSRLITHTSDHMKTHATESEILEEVANVDYSKSIPSKSDYVTESAAQITVAASNHEALSFTKKLNFLQLNNKNLNEDISSLEDGLKVLTKMVSHFNNKTGEKSKADTDERSTSQDISEIISKSVLSDKVTNIGDEEKGTVSLERDINTDHPSISTNDKKSSNDLSHDEYISERVDSEISAVIPEEALALSNSPHEIDYEAKSKEIMNEIERSIISEHTKMARGDYNVSSVLENDMQNLRKDNEELLSDLVSLEQDIKSISEIFTQVSESRRSLDRATNTAMRIIGDSKENVIVQTDLNRVKLEEDTMKDQADLTHSSKLLEHSSVTSMHSPIIAGHRSKESGEMNSQVDLQSARNTISNRTSHVLSENLKSSDDIPEILETEASVVDDFEISKNSKSNEEDIRTTAPNDTANSTIFTTNTDQNRSHSTRNISLDKDDWTTSESFEVPQNEISIGEGGEKEDVEFEDSRSNSDRTNSNNSSDKKNISYIDDTINQETGTNLMSDVDALMLIPKGGSTNIAVYNETFENVITKPHAMKRNDEFDDILDIIAKENNQRESVPDNGNGKFDNLISDSMADLLDRVESIVENNGEIMDSGLKGILCDNEPDVPINDRAEIVPDTSVLSKDMQNKINAEDVSESNNIRFINRGEVTDASLRIVNEISDRSAVSIDLHVRIDSEESPREPISEAQEIMITELDSDSVEDHILPEIEIDAKIELAEDEESLSADDTNEKGNHYVVEGSRDLEIQECLEPILEQDSSDGEQLDNLVEVTMSRLDTVEKPIALLRASTKPMTDDEVSVMQAEETQEETRSGATNMNTSPSKRIDETIQDTPIIDNINKTFDILKDPDYEDISEESFEVSEILDKNESSRTAAGVTKKFTGLPEKYQATQKSEEVLRILDEISQKSSSGSGNDSQRDERNVCSAQSITENINEILGVEVSAKDNVPSHDVKQMTEDNNIADEFYKTGELMNRSSIEAASQGNCKSVEAAGLSEEKSGDSDNLASRLKDEGLQDDKSSRLIYELRKKVSRLQEQDGSSESSEAGDTPRGVPEIEMDSPRDFNDSRLDIDILDDDLLSGGKTTGTSQNIDINTNLHSTSLVTTSEKDIEAMIDKLKASLEQPGLEVAELEAKLLRIEQLQIELEIKKLEAEEVSYYVREIPNKPPPPYTPPGDGRLSASLGSPSLLTAVIPSNVEELTSFTEKATAVIYNTKLAGEDIASLEAPPEIYELTKEKNEIVTKDQRIYNTFLFDLCKETIAEVYRAEYEKPGPSWTRPNVKTKPTVKVPRTVGELTEYVAKEVATLFGFKTRLQRENMVMRWSRKRRDRVDELLAREAQAEEDEWTKFHHDELAVKNGLTVAIIDSLMMETANIVKIAYGKKRRMMV